ncbi:mite allergen der f 3-like protein [Lasius niger]|uniref:Mite allergen der f 3-like protein n=1 Tax=Lasius niger TaxID=67767 RepID=A0A0J7KKU8_LASNI|nr:mite allergen der f 3-like protein [Lasius niger]
MTLMRAVLHKGRERISLEALVALDVTADLKVSLQYIRDSSFHFCGGSILNEYYVITAAHCVENEIAADIIIVAGIVNLNHPYLSVTRTIEQIISHKEYNPNNSLNDIALIKVFTPFKSSGNIGFVTLPKQDEAVQQGTVARFSGFSQRESEVLQQVTIYITDQEYCKNIFNTSPRNIYDIHICANNTNINRGTYKVSCEEDI